MMLKLGTLAICAIFLSAPQLGRLNTSEAITYAIEDGKGVPGYRESDRELAKLALDAWSRESGGQLKFTEAKTDGALIRIRWISPNEGLYGETQRVQVNGKAGAIVYVMPQVSAQGEPLASRAVQDNLLRETIVYLTCVHELGHAVGLQHTRKFDDIMYYFGYGGNIVDYFMRYRNKLQSRADIAKYSGVSASDVEALHNVYRN
jgi:Matrixin